MRRLKESLIMTALAWFMLFVVVIPSYTYTISGELISVSETSKVSSKVETSDSHRRHQSDIEHGRDANNITVSISYGLTNEDGITRLKEMEKYFENGLVKFEGIVNEPTPMDIAVTTPTKEAVKLRVVIEPGDDFSFEFIDNPKSKPDKLIAVGTLRRYEDIDQKFSISGDLSSMNIDLTSTIVEVLAWEHYPTTGDMNEFDFGTVQLDNGNFLIEGQVREPTVAVVVIAVGSAYTQFQAIVEPKADITVSARGTLYTLGASAKSGRHAKLVDSWRASEEYSRLADEYDVAWQEYYQKPKKTSEIAELGNGKENPSSQSTENDSPMDTETSDSTDPEESGAQPTDSQSTSASNIANSLTDDGCEHVEIAEAKTVQVTDSLDQKIPLHHRLSQQMDQIRANALEYIADNAEEPIDVLLALEMDAYWGTTERLLIFDKLSAPLDEDLVARRVTHARNRHASYLESKGVLKSLTRGRKAPEFTLPNLEGQNVSLIDLTTKNELVLIDFWASWCGPCIKSFPALKNIYASYKDEGFEIVSISLDNKREMWEQGSAEHALPWVDLGQVSGFDGNVAKSFGVTSIPKGFLVDSEGCIIHTYLSSDQLEEILIAKLGK